MAKQAVEIIGVPMDLGANIRGANMGPAAIRIAELHRKIRDLGYTAHEAGDIDVPIRDALPGSASEQKYLPQILDVCHQLQEVVYGALSQGRTPLTIGGDHGLAIGSVTGVSRHYRERNESIGLIWVDAHADINTPDTSPSGNIHGMPLAVLIGHGHESLVNLGGFRTKVKPENVALIGIRAIDGNERELCRKSGISYFTMRDIDERGMHAVMEEALRVAGRGTAGIHLSLDLDGIDPLYAPGVSTPVTGGLSYREIHLALEMLADTKLMSSLDIVELNPMTDTGHQTAQLAVELVQSALGKSIV